MLVSWFGFCRLTTEILEQWPIRENLMSPYFSPPTLLQIYTSHIQYTVFAAAAEMTEADKAAEESAANAAEAEMAEAAAPYAPPEGSSGTLLQFISFIYNLLYLYIYLYIISFFTHCLHYIISHSQTIHLMTIHKHITQPSNMKQRYIKCSTLLLIHSTQTRIYSYVN